MELDIRRARAKAAAAARRQAKLIRATEKAREVFSIPELLDMILLMVDDMPTLIASVPLVCRLWKEHIEDSPKLQRVLFFAPDLKTSLSDGNAKAQSFHLNPLLAKHFGLLVQAPASFGTKSVPQKIGITQLEKMNISIAKVDDQNTHARFAHKDASWRRMLITQPPARKIGFVRPHNEFHSPSILEKTLLKDGLLMGQLWDSIYYSLWAQGTGNVRTCKVRMAYRLGSQEDHSWSKTASSLNAGYTTVRLLKAKSTREQTVAAALFLSKGYDENEVLATIEDEKIECLTPWCKALANTGS
ncbi:unnamed protein product [Clonostachys rosea]|uniref:F-box domain-containing protein n=1 Tax=Bionectria ochroleuca TaxID=29856 RepID=A0ABY6UKP3_BIOOC|nr:unnamed protein product [Clonostachys rosea]